MDADSDEPEGDEQSEPAETREPSDVTQESDRGATAESQILEKTQATEAPSNAPEKDLDDEDSGQIRVAFAFVTLVAGIVCLVPRQWMSALVLFGLSLGITVVHRVKKARAQTSS
ncbi:MAG: hypothetical protein U0271_21700 [Polyangiaceae bacterium]